MKKIYSLFALAMTLLLGGVATANAQETLTVAPVTVAPGEQAQVVINYESTVEHYGFNMQITLPEGLSFVEDETTKVAFTLGSSALPTHTLSSKITDKNARIIVIELMKNPLSNGDLLSFNVIADENLAENSDIVISGVKFNGGQYLDEIKVPVTKGTPTGINSIEANSEKAESFNLAGQKVSANAKGIRIQNGKKVVVK